MTTIERATAAHLRFGGEQPSATLSTEHVMDGTTFVRLANINGLLAIYRVTLTGRVRRLKEDEEGFLAEHGDNLACVDP